MWRATTRAISIDWLKPRSRCRAAASGNAMRTSGRRNDSGARNTAAASACPSGRARASRCSYLSPCTSRSRGNAYAQAASVALKAGGCLRHAPHVVAPGEGCAHEGHAGGNAGSAFMHGSQTMRVPQRAAQSAQDCGNACAASASMLRRRAHLPGFAWLKASGHASRNCESRPAPVPMPCMPGNMPDASLSNLDDVAFDNSFRLRPFMAAILEGSGMSCRSSIRHIAHRSGA